MISLLFASALTALSPEATLRAKLQSRAEDLPKNYREIFCSEAIPLAESQTTVAIECHFSTSCGPSGEFVVYAKGRTPNAPWSESLKLDSGGYMGGDFITPIDIDADGFAEIVEAGGTDGTTKAKVAVWQQRQGAWANLLDETSCQGSCAFHDVFLADLDEDRSPELVVWNHCESEDAQGQACTPQLGWFQFEEGVARYQEGSSLESTHRTKWQRLVNAGLALTRDAERSRNFQRFLANGRR